MFSPKLAIPLFLSQQQQAVTQWQGVAIFLGMMHAYSNLVPAIEKFYESRVLGPTPFKESTRDIQYKSYKEFMEWLTAPLTKKVTVSIVNRKLQDVRQLQGINTHVYRRDLPIDDNLCYYTGFH